MASVEQAAGVRSRRFAPWVRVVVGVATVVLIASCANESTDDDADGSSGASTTTTATDASAPEGDGSEDEPGASASAATPPASGWQTVVAPADCMCSDGSEFRFWIHRGTSQRVVFFLEGGGACFSADTCGPANPSYTRNLTGASDTPPGGGDTGIFDFANPDNPFRNDSVVFVPYCTGDLHTGNAVHDYGDGVVIRHNGYTNASAALAATAAAFPSATELVVAGSSAGSAGSPLFAGLAHDVLPEVAITLIADGSGAYPGTEAITAAIGGLWGRDTALPRWPTSAGEPTSAWSLPGIFVRAGKHNPEMRIATINSAYDETQTSFVKKAGFPQADLLSMIDGNTASIESAGVDVAAWVGPGTMHTVLQRPEFYTDEVTGVRLRDWVTDLVAGSDVDDVHCTECSS